MLNFKQKFINTLNLPNSILVENESSFQIYNEGNYKNINIMKSIPRLEYLKLINRIKKESTNHLIACGLHDGYLLFNEMLNTIRKEKSIIFFFFKFIFRVS